jgi:predicted TIM-barrel fold metal-dependent hydrolase
LRRRCPRRGSSSIISGSPTSVAVGSTGGAAISTVSRNCPNVRAKLSGLVTEADWNAWTIEDIHRYISAALDSFGAERLMIGSDWPVLWRGRDVFAGDRPRPVGSG